MSYPLKDQVLASPVKSQQTHYLSFLSNQELWDISLLSFWANKNQSSWDLTMEGNRGNCVSQGGLEIDIRGGLMYKPAAQDDSVLKKVS